MKNLIKNKPFIFGFVFGIFLMILANIYLAIIDIANFCSDCYLTLGFPYPIYRNSAISGFEKFVWTSILPNILITIIFSFLIGLLFKFVLLKIISKK